MSLDTRDGFTREQSIKSNSKVLFSQSAFLDSISIFQVKLYYFKLIQNLMIDFDVVIEGVNCRKTMSSLLKINNLQSFIKSFLILTELSCFEQLIQGYTHIKLAWWTNNNVLSINIMAQTYITFDDDLWMIPKQKSFPRLRSIIKILYANIKRAIMTCIHT